MKKNKSLVLLAKKGKLVIKSLIPFMIIAALFAPNAADANPKPVPFHHCMQHCGSTHGPMLPPTKEQQESWDNFWKDLWDAFMLAKYGMGAV